MRSPANRTAPRFPVLAGVAAVLAALAAPAARAEPLLWPTDAGRCITATFCEFRPGHFHSGMDISTWGRTGYRCFAVGSGEIARVRVSCHGYGRAVYLRLDDGRTAVYAHLDRFAGALADTVRAIQERGGSAYFDREFEAGTFRVERGQVVAFTGQSGIGVPHLHFEMRDASEHPLDPMDVGFAVEDTSPPVITRIAITPLTPVSSVDGRSDTMILDVHPGESGGSGRIPRTIPVEGEVGIAIEVSESIDACRYRLAPKRIALREPGSAAGEVLYSVEYDRFSFAETGLMDFQIDPRFSYSKVGRFHNLWRRPGNELAFAQRSAGDGVLRARQLPKDERALVRPAGASTGGLPTLGSVQRPGERVRKLELAAEDAAGNRATVSLALSFAPPPALSVLDAGLARSAAADFTGAGLTEAWSDTLEVVGVVQGTGRALRHVELDFSFDNGETWHQGPRVIPSRDLSFETRFPALGRVPGEGRGVLVRGRVLDVLGAAGITRTVAVAGTSAPAERPLPFEVVTLGPWAEVRVPSSIGWSLVAGGWDGDRAVLVRPWGRGIRIVREPAGADERVREWSGTGREWKGFDPWGRPVALSFRLPVASGPDRTEPVVATGDRSLGRFALAPGVFQETAGVMIREEPAPSPNRELVPLGPVHFLDAGQVPLAAEFDVSLFPEEGATFDENRVGIFRQDRDRFEHVSSERDPRTGAWIASTRTPLGLALFEDVVRPQIADARLENGKGRPRLAFLATDEGSGVNCDGIEVIHAGESLVTEFDEETHVGFAYPRLADRAADQEFEIRATDRCGNSSRAALTLRLP